MYPTLSAAADLLDEDRHTLIGFRPIVRCQCAIIGCTAPRDTLVYYQQTKVYLHRLDLLIRTEYSRFSALILSDTTAGVCRGHYEDDVVAVATPAEPLRGPYPWSPT